MAEDFNKTIKKSRDKTIWNSGYSKLLQREGSLQARKQEPETENPVLGLELPKRQEYNFDKITTPNLPWSDVRKLEEEEQKLVLYQNEIDENKTKQNDLEPISNIQTEEPELTLPWSGVKEKTLPWTGVRELDPVTPQPEEEQKLVLYQDEIQQERASLPALEIPTILEEPDEIETKEIDLTKKEQLDTPSSMRSGFLETSLGGLESGDLIGNYILEGGYIRSGNYIEGSSGWKLDPEEAQLVNVTLVGGIIRYGKTTFDNTEEGYIIGPEDETAKFYIGNTTDYFNWDGTNISLMCSSGDAITIDYGSDLLLKEGGDIKFTSIDAPTACTGALAGDGAGNVDNGEHKYKVTFGTATGETELGTISNTVTVVDKTSDGKINLTDIPIGTSGATTSRKIYRTKAEEEQKIVLCQNEVDVYYYFIAEINDNTTTTYTDNKSDASITEGAANFKENDTFGKITIDGKESLSLGESNVFIGQYAGRFSIIGSNNIAIGTEALLLDNNGFNIAIGYHTLRNNESWGNCAVGYNSMGQNSDGYSNIAFGGESLLFNEDGNYNCAIGTSSLRLNVSGDTNTAVGSHSGSSNSTGNGNVALGFFSGYWETGSNSFYVDNQNRTNTAGDKSKALLYGTFAATTAAQFLRVNANLGLLTNTFGTSADGVLGIANGTVPSTSPVNMIQIFSTDISGDDATLGIRTEASVAAEVDETKFSHKLPVKINGSTYYIMLTDS